MLTRRTALVAAVGAVLAVLVPVAACGGTDPGPPPAVSGIAADVAAEPSIAATVPASVRAAGVLTVAVSNQPPASYQGPDGQLTGWDVELARGIGAVLDLPVQLQMIDFASLVPGLQAGRFDLGMGNVAITEERLRIVEMVSTHEAYAVFMAPAGSGLALTSLADVCGRTLAVLAGGVEAQAAQDQQPGCAAAGRPPIEIQQYGSQPEVNLALQSGRAEVEAAASDFLAYVLTQSPGVFELVGRYGPTQLTGIAVARDADSAQLAESIAQAVRRLVATGTYDEIFQVHNAGLGTIPADRVQVNPVDLTSGG